jgi:hypothetical protein
MKMKIQEIALQVLPVGFTTLPAKIFDLYQKVLRPGEEIGVESLNQ